MKTKLNEMLKIVEKASLLYTLHCYRQTFVKHAEKLERQLDINY